MISITILICLIAGTSSLRDDEALSESQQEKFVDHANHTSNDMALLAGKMEALDYAITVATLNCLMMRTTKVAAGTNNYDQEAKRLVVKLFMLDLKHMGSFMQTWLNDLKAFFRAGFSDYDLVETVDNNNFNDYRMELMKLGRNKTQVTEVYETLQRGKFQDLYGAGVKLPGPDTVGFDYNFERDQCIPEKGSVIYNKIKAYVDSVADELAGGECEGSCAQFSFMSSTCGLKQEGRPCPEGTACTCKRSANTYAPVVFIGSYIGIFLTQGAVLTMAGKPYLIAVMPVDPWAIAVTGYFAVNVDGCMCLAKECTILQTTHGEQVCGVEPSKSDFVTQEVALPFLGTKCAMLDSKCEKKKCEPEDIVGFGRLGVFEGSTYNCWRQFWDDWNYQPRKDRFRVYQNQLDV